MRHIAEKYLLPLNRILDAYEKQIRSKYPRSLKDERDLYFLTLIKHSLLKKY